MQKILITTEELAQHVDDPGWVVFDTRHDLMDAEKGRRAYAAGHVPGAYFLHVDDDLAGPKTGSNGRHPLPDLGEFAAKINAMQRISRVPLIASADLEPGLGRLEGGLFSHYLLDAGSATVFPSNMAIAATGRDEDAHDLSV